MCSCQIFKLFKIHRQRNSFSHPLSPTPVCTPPTAPLNTLPAFCYLSAPQFPLIPFPPPTIRCLHFAEKSWQSSFPSTIILPAPYSSTQTNLSLFFFSALTRGPDAEWRARCGVVRFGAVICLRTYAQTQQSRRWLKELQLEISAGTVSVIGWWITSARGKLIPSYPECTGNMIRTIGRMCCGASELEFVQITCP